MARTLIIAESTDDADTMFGYIIPANDRSMEGPGGDSFPPGTEAIIDIARPIQPGDFVLIRPKGMQGWLLRQYQGGLPLSLAKEYTLRALNPVVEPIRVTDPQNWDVGGRLIKVLRTY